MIQSLYFKSLGRLFCEKIDHRRIFEIVYFLKFLGDPPSSHVSNFLLFFYLLSKFGPFPKPPPPVLTRSSRNIVLD